MSKNLSNKILSLRFKPDAPKERISYGDALTLANQLAVEHKRYLEAEYILDQLLAKQPGEINCLLSMAYSYQYSYQMAKAKAAVEKILAMQPRNIQALSYAANIQQYFGNGAAAIKHIKRALKLQPEHPILTAKLADAYGQNGDRDKALKYYDKAIMLDPNEPRYYYSKSRLTSGEFSPQELSHMRSLKEEGLGADQRAALAFSLAAACRSTQQFDEEFSYLDRGNAVVWQQSPWNEAFEVEKIATIIDTFDAPFCQSVESQETGGAIPLFVTSLPRSGSTLLEKVIASHSAVSSCGESEAFTLALEAVSKQQKGHLGFWEWESASAFSAFLPAVKENAKQLLEGFSIETPYYSEKSISNAITLGIQLLAYPQSKAVEITRHPLDVCLSGYQIHFGSGVQASNHLPAMAKSIQLYERIMAHWKRCFPERILSIEYAELIEQQKVTTARVLEFCGLDWDDQCLDFHASTGAVTTASSWQVRQPIYRTSLDRWRRYGRLLQPAADVLGITIE